MQQQSPRYIVGIDLGTTNSSVAYLDTDRGKNPRFQIKTLAIPQLTAVGVVEAKVLLPSFCYLAGEGEFPVNSLRLPWQKYQAHDYFVGELAKEQGVKVPTRLVQSAKSWLCNQAADRRESILPFEAADQQKRISPIEATARYLRHLLEAWNDQIAKGEVHLELQEQEVILTVPASFDEVARLLTVEAAKLAGLTRLTLVEEPQAAFYSWILDHEAEWKSLFQEGDSILVCDIGGGTTDFSLIEVCREEGGELFLQRMSVGNHLLLGGDNFDQALCHYLEKKLEQRTHQELNPKQWLQLLGLARDSKEKLFGGKSPHLNLFIQGSGSKVIEGGIGVELTKDELESLLIDGFFGSYEFEEAVKVQKKSGLRTMGLPYEVEPSVTKHLACFLHHSRPPSYLLFNGGSLKPLPFRQAIISSLQRWFGKAPKELTSSSLDLAVSRGAVYFGKARRGFGVRMSSGSARTYYLVIDVDRGGVVEKKALTLLPRGTQEGVRLDSSKTFSLIPNAYIAFHLLTSNTRLHDQPGDLVEIKEEEMFPLPPIYTRLRYGKKEAEKIPVRLSIQLSELGTLELSLRSEKSDHQWLLEFQLKSVSGEDNTLFALEKRQVDELVEAQELTEAENVVTAVFSSHSSIPPQKLMGELEKALQRPKNEWSQSVLRSLWKGTLTSCPHRLNSIEHEARWWNLAGFLLRPGFGYPLDDFRMKEIWKIILADFKNIRSLDVQIQRWICYRRIAGGLSKGQQTQLLSEILPPLIKLLGNNKEIKARANEYIEQMRVVASMELIDLSSKIKLGELLLKRILSGAALESDYWSLGRIGARHLLYGSLIDVVPRDICGKWVKELLAKEEILPKEALFFVFEQLARKTEQREINLPGDLIEPILSLYSQSPKIERLRQLLKESTPLSRQEQESIYGERLPTGLTLTA